jgi:hypothetical protein
MSIIDNVRPMLDPNEKLQYAMTGQIGVNPGFLWLPFLRWIMITNRARVIAITDVRIAIFAGGQLHWQRSQPKQFLYSVARSTVLEHGTGSWSKVAIGDEHIWISRKAYAYMDEASAGAGA